MRKEVPVMTRGELICPAGSGSKSAGLLRERRSISGFKGAISRLRHLFHTAPAAVRGDSKAVMDQYMKYHRERR